MIITQYKIVEDSSGKGLRETINNLAKSSWRLIGPVQVIDGLYFVATMQREEIVEHGQDIKP